MSCLGQRKPRSRAGLSNDEAAWEDGVAEPHRKSLTEALQDDVFPVQQITIDEDKQMTISSRSDDVERTSIASGSKSSLTKSVSFESGSFSKLRATKSESNLRHHIQPLHSFATKSSDEGEFRRQRCQSFPSSLSSSRRGCRIGSTPSTSSSSFTWKRFSGRTYGSPSYENGDFMRGLKQAASVVSTSFSSSFHSFDDSAITSEELEPIDEDGNKCAWLASRSWLSWRKPSMLVSFQLPESSVVGDGQYGRVWRARSTRTNMVYAVKTTQVTARDDSLALRELEVGELVMKSPHPCMVRVFRVLHEEDSGTCYVVMEYCPGGDLLGRIRQSRIEATDQAISYTPPTGCMRWVAQIFLALEHVHVVVGLLFRDLKPANVVFSGGGCAKLTDFGLSRCGTSSEGAWTFGFPAGTIGYTAPEIIENEKYDHRADLYSFGVLLWVLLTGGVTDHADPTPPMNGVDDDWDLMSRCLEKPEENRARPLEEPELSLVKSLVARDPYSRPEHQDIRRHELFAAQRIPDTVSVMESPGNIAQCGLSLNRRSGYSATKSDKLEALLDWLQDDGTGQALKCNTPGCIRESWNRWPGETCCRTCVKSDGAMHGPNCNRRWNPEPIAEENPKEIAERNAQLDTWALLR